MRPKGGDEVLLTLSGRQSSTAYTEKRGARLMATMPKQAIIEDSLMFALEVLQNNAGLSVDFVSAFGRCGCRALPPATMVSHGPRTYLRQLCHLSN